jgi:hypothetical protein
MFRASMFALAMLFAAYWLNEYLHPATEDSIDSERVVSIRQKLKICSEPERCTGGFVKFANEDFIYRIDYTCSFARCCAYTLGLSHLLSLEANLINRIEYFALPHDSPSETWEDIALRYARQFVK